MMPVKYLLRCFLLLNYVPVGSKKILKNVIEISRVFLLLD